MVDGNNLGSTGFKYLGVPYSTMDCQAFVEKCLSDCGLRIDLPGSNAWYRRVMEEGWVGTPEECTKLHGKVPTGAFLFILEHDGKEPDKYKKDGIGNASHIGIVTNTGEGGIHSSASRGCVAESKFKGKTIPNGGWNRVGLWTENVTYDGISPEPEPGPEPGPEPEPSTAVVFAPTGSTVNMRSKPSKSAALVERIPIGETVEILSYGDEWCKCKWKWYTGWIMTEFLLFDDPPLVDSYTIMIFDLTKEEADRLHEQFPDSQISVG